MTPDVNVENPNREKPQDMIRMNRKTLIYHCIPSYLVRYDKVQTMVRCVACLPLTSFYTTIF